MVMEYFDMDNFMDIGCYGDYKASTCGKCQNKERYYGRKICEEKRKKRDQIRAGCCRPVSYTHLDVYKRQDIRRPLVICRSCFMYMPAIRLTLWLVLWLRLVSVTVSYTHLFSGSGSSRWYNRYFCFPAWIWYDCSASRKEPVESLGMGKAK